jgi:hypothetical protein
MTARFSVPLRLFFYMREALNQMDTVNRPPRLSMVSLTRYGPFRSQQLDEIAKQWSPFK